MAKSIIRELVDKNKKQLNEEADRMGFSGTGSRHTLGTKYCCAYHAGFEDGILAFSAKQDELFMKEMGKTNV